MTKAVNLHRTFSTFSEADEYDHDFVRDWSGFPTNGKPWEEILKSERVVILAEAGAGKTYEMQKMARRLKKEGRAAFFMELADLAESSPGEILSPEDEALFASWLESGEEGWFFLDSVDESRLGDPRNFKKALRRLGRSIHPHLARAHIFISCRVSDWQANFDREQVASVLPMPVHQTGTGDEASDQKPSGDEGKPADAILVVKLDELSRVQMRQFAEAHEGIDVPAFMASLEQADAAKFAERPADLIEIIGYWREHGRVGSHAEMIEFDIKTKLVENKVDRSLEQPLSAEKALEGAVALAAGLTFAKAGSILLPDSSPAPERQHNAIRPGDILVDWDAGQIQALLTRPVFDEATYGRVRFHHRSVREYLTARWLWKLLQKGRSRRAIEGLLFATRYGLELAVPYMQPVAAWLALWDERVAKRLLAVAPEVLINYGDSSQLPVSFREAMLRRIFTLYDDERTRLSFDIAAVQRFATPELAPVLLELMEMEPGNDDIRHLLLRAVAQGEIRDCADMAMASAFDKKMDSYTRVYAIKAVAKVGSDAQKRELVASIKSVPEEWGRTLVGNALFEFFPDYLDVDDFLTILQAFPSVERFSHDWVGYFLEEFPLTSLSSVELLRFIESMVAMAEREVRQADDYARIPDSVEPLLKSAVKAIEHLCKVFPEVVGGDDIPEPILSALEVASSGWARHAQGIEKKIIQEVITQQTELRRALFWRFVGQRRAKLEKKGERLANFWQVLFDYYFVDLPYEDFRFFARCINLKTGDDKEVALSAAHSIWRNNHSTSADLKLLREAVAGQGELEERLSELVDWVGPLAPHPEILEMEIREEARRKEKAEEERTGRQKRAEWIAGLQANPGRLRVVSPDTIDDLWMDFYRLFMVLYESSPNRNETGIKNWQLLEAEFGFEVAKTYRDGLVAFWRIYTPTLASEREEARTPWDVHWGMSGIAIEAAEKPGWAGRLTSEEALLASRYSTCELNEFPVWIKDVAVRHTDAFLSVVGQEVSWELGRENHSHTWPQLLSKVVKSPDEVVGLCLETIIELLEDREPVNDKAIDKGLTCLLSRGGDIERLLRLARSRYEQSAAKGRRLTWLLAWICIEAEGALDALDAWLKSIADPGEAGDLVMSLAVSLADDSDGRCFDSRLQDYLRPEPLKRLVRLTYKHVRVEEDQQRNGVYTPNKRDHAQNARWKLAESLAARPSRESHAALTSLATELESESSREIMLYLARMCAEKAAEPAPWKTEDVLEFARTGTSAPRTDRELFDLALLRLDDVKFNLEQGDASVAALLKRAKDEPEVRVYFTDEFRKAANGLYSIVPEEEMADKKKPDLKFHAMTVESTVPVELKIADNWSLADLKGQIHNQLVGQYLRAEKTRYGIFLLVCNGKSSWRDPAAGQRVDSFDDLCRLLQQEADTPLKRDVEVEEIRVVGIDLTKRGRLAE
ncbi:MAG: hypothetical protein H0S80_14580 [Desulfovibrionaceae bacterium]|nr:hypothetical protein [Desulfovibrionaceae bacterium]